MVERAHFKVCSCCYKGVSYGNVAFAFEFTRTWFFSILFFCVTVTHEHIPSLDARETILGGQDELL
jgi:hypothetical protein